MAEQIPKARFPELAYLIECYVGIPDDLDTIVKGYLVANGKSRALKVTDEIIALLKAGYGEDGLRIFLMDTLSSSSIVNNSATETFRYIQSLLESLLQSEAS